MKMLLIINLCAIICCLYLEADHRWYLHSRSKGQARSRAAKANLRRRQTQAYLSNLCRLHIRRGPDRPASTPRPEAPAQEA